jgi:hypothetical protein
VRLFDIFFNIVAYFKLIFVCIQKKTKHWVCFLL